MNRTQASVLPVTVPSLDKWNHKELAPVLLANRMLVLLAEDNGRRKGEGSEREKKCRSVWVRVGTLNIQTMTGL